MTQQVFLRGPSPFFKHIAASNKLTSTSACTKSQRLGIRQHELLPICWVTQQFNHLRNVVLSAFNLQKSEGQVKEKEEFFSMDSLLLVRVVIEMEIISV